MRLMIILLLFILSGCSTGIRQSGYGSNYFEVRQHFTNESQYEADTMAQSRCAGQNATAKLVTFKKGGLFGATEYHYYTYQCISNQSIAEDRQVFDTKSCIGWGFSMGTDAFANCMLRLYEVRIAVENAASTSKAIRKMSEQQRRNAESEQAFRLLNLNKQNQPQKITPFNCRRNGIFVTCQ
jgi:hypothetical protein